MTEETPLDDEQKHLVETHRKLAYSIAMDFWRKNMDGMDRAEVISISYQGLMTAAIRFDKNWRPPADPNYNPFLAFGAFAKRRISGAILDWQRNQDHVPRRQRSTYKTLQEQGHGSGRSAQELSDLTGLSIGKIKAITYAVEASIVSLDDTWHDTEDPGSVEGSALVSAIQTAVADKVKEFHPLQRSVFVLRYYSACDFPAIAAELGISTMTARTLHSEALLSLHPLLRNAAS